MLILRRMLVFFQLQFPTGVLPLFWRLWWGRKSFYVHFSRLLRRCFEQRFDEFLQCTSSLSDSSLLGNDSLPSLCSSSVSISSFDSNVVLYFYVSVAVSDLRLNNDLVGVINKLGSKTFSTAYLLLQCWNSLREERSKCRWWLFYVEGTTSPAQRRDKPQICCQSACWQRHSQYMVQRLSTIVVNSFSIISFTEDFISRTTTLSFSLWRLSVGRW